MSRFSSQTAPSGGPSGQPSTSGGRSTWLDEVKELRKKMGGFYDAWSAQTREENDNKPPTREQVKEMLAICEEFGEDYFQEMLREQFGRREGDVPVAPGPKIADTNVSRALKEEVEEAVNLDGSLKEVKPTPPSLPPAPIAPPSVPAAPPVTPPANIARAPRRRQLMCVRLIKPQLSYRSTKSSPISVRPKSSPVNLPSTTASAPQRPRRTSRSSVQAANQGQQ
jgi:hypothetical protein